MKPTIQERLINLGIDSENVKIINQEIDILINKKAEPYITENNSLKKIIKDNEDSYRLLKNNYDSVNQKIRDNLVDKIVTKLTSNNEKKEILKKLTSLNDEDYSNEESLEKKFQETISNYQSTFNEEPSNTLGKDPYSYGNNPWIPENKKSVNPSKFDKPMVDPTE